MIVGILMGGMNTEHEVSLVSARSVIDNLNKDKYEVVEIKIDKEGRLPEPLEKILKEKRIEIVFPVLHGPYGEDGTIQGWLEMLKIPYVGCGVLGSALCMDKVAQKQICEFHGLPIVEYVWGKKVDSLIKKAEKIGFPCFVKPVNQGSSVGITKANNKQELKKSIDLAFKYDEKVLIEKAVKDARQIECSVLGNDEVRASVLGEIVASNEFYDYNAKYVDGKSKEIIPAKLPKKLVGEIRKTAIKAFKILNGSGLARADFLLERKTNKFYLSELNAMPGFTSISMYPKLWQASGLSYQDLLDRLIELGMERFERRSKLEMSLDLMNKWYEK